MVITTPHHTIPYHSIPHQHRNSHDTFIGTVVFGDIRSKRVVRTFAGAHTDAVTQVRFTPGLYTALSFFNMHGCDLVTHQTCGEY